MPMTVCPQFFQKRGVAEAMNPYDLFNAVSGLNIAVGVEDKAEADFISEVNEHYPKNYSWRLNHLIVCGADIDCGSGEEE